MATKKKKPLCRVKGQFKVGNRFGICPHIGFGESGTCGAHGNFKCEHKIIDKEDV